MAGKIDFFDSVINDGVYPITVTSNRWTAQTFTASTSYSCSSVELPLAISSADSDVVLYVYIHAVDVNRKPTGSALATGTISGSSLSTSTSWVSCSFSTACSIVASTEYAIVLYCSVGDGKTITWYGELTGNVYAGKCWYDGNTTSMGSWTESTVSDVGFRTYAGTPVGISYVKKLVAISNGEVWYESSAGTMTELTAANGTINTSLDLMAIEAFQKVFVVNKTNLKILDYINTKINTSDAGANPCTPGMVLTGGTSAASMVVDYVDGITDDVAANIYGYRTTTTTFISGETVTGTNSSDAAVSFVTSAAETAPPHWYNWTVFGNDTTNYGTMPTTSTLIALYRGRIIINDNKRPHAWYMAKVGNPFKFLYDFTNDGDLSAVTYSNTKVGEIGDIITALIAYKDDLMIFGCANSIWILIGDPLGSGQIAQITDKTGIWGAKSWCMDDKRNLFFLGNDGIYRMPINESYSLPENISKITLPNLKTDLDLDQSLHRVSLHFDPVHNGILICKTTLSDGSNKNYWFDLLTQGFYDETYPNSCGVFSGHYYPATDDTYKKFLIGCNDGYIREFDNSTKNDATTSSTSIISSYLAVVRQLAEDEDSEGKLRWINGITAGGASDGDFLDTDAVSYEIHVNDDAETVLEDIKDGATAFDSGTWTGTGKQTKHRVRARGYWWGLKLYNSTASQTWAMNKVYADIIPAGKG